MVGQIVILGFVRPPGTYAHRGMFHWYAPHGLSEAGCVLLLGIHQQRADEERVVGGSEVGAGSALVPDVEQKDLGVSLRHAQSVSHQVDRHGQQAHEPIRN